MRIPLASDGYRFILPLLALTVVLAWLNWALAAGLAFLGLAFVTNFFRDPERAIPQLERVVVSPADGKVVEIVREQDPLLPAPAIRISIFLNVFNVHVNRVPVAGKIAAIRYNKGKFLNAASHKASLDNEQNALLIETGRFQILVKQIAGLVARRIVCWAHEGRPLNSASVSASFASAPVQTCFCPRVPKSKSLLETLSRAAAASSGSCPGTSE